jgi:hypothetical protein
MSRLSRRTHRVLGLILLLAICAWATTGFIFFVKPGYGPAYGGLHVRRYGLDGAAVPQPRPEWLEVRLVRTVLGDHVLARVESGAVQLDPATLSARELPEESDIRRLISDAIGPEHDRYGEIASVARHPGDAPSASIVTTTGVTIELDWATLSLQQSGRDTRRIDALYRVHYLQWTGIKALDRVLGVVGLASLLVLAFFGLRLAFAARAS